MDLNYSDRAGNTALHCAVLRNRVEICKALVDTGKLDLSRGDQEGNTALHLAVGLYETMDIDVADTDRSTFCLDFLSNRLAILEIFKPLIASGKMDPNLTNYEGDTALHLAVRLPIVIKDKDNADFHLAFLKHRLDILEIFKPLIASGKIDPNLKNRRQRTALHVAVLRNEVSIVEFLIPFCTLDLQDYIYIDFPKGTKLLHFTILNNSLAIVKVLINSGKVNLNSRDTYGYTPLHVAIAEKNLAIVELLTQFDTIDKKGNGIVLPHFHFAVLHNCLEIVQWLIQFGKIAINAKDVNLHTALYYAKKNGNTEMEHLLLKAGAV